MRMFNRGAFAAAALAAMVASPASAQQYRWDFGIKGGYSWYTQSLEQDRTNNDGIVRFGHGPLVGAQLTHWNRNRLGLRLNFDYQDRSIDSHPLGGSGTREVWDDVNIWTATGDVLFRFAEPTQTWTGAQVLPYLALGLGAKNHHPPRSPFTISEQGATTGTQAAVFTPRNSAGQPVGPVIGMPSSWRLTGLVGLGADLRVAPGFAVRVEAFDRIFRPALDLLVAQQPGASPTNWNRVPDNQNPRASQLTHELGLSLGLHLVTGLIPPPIVSMPTPPAPPPVAPPPAAPPAAPREDRIMVCVIDPAAPGGIRMQEAWFRQQQRDTVVEVGGQRVALRTQVTDIPTAARADWYVRGEPLAFMVGTRRMEFQTWQTPRQIEANQLTYLGRVNGVPVFADRDEAQRFATQLQTARAARADHELTQILAGDRVLRDAVADLAALWVPMQPVGCVFQGFQPAEAAGKGK
jgi:opacity protein-like surface antigen